MDSKQFDLKSMIFTNDLPESPRAGDGLLNFDARSQLTSATAPPPPQRQSNAFAAPLPPFAPALIALSTQIRQDLEANISKLLSLNPGRREAIARHLEHLAGVSADSAGGLRKWVDNIHTAAEDTAIKTFCEEVALIALGQAIVLKAWHDKGLRTFVSEDLGRLNWAMSSALKSSLPVDREGWQITRPNLYSWYNPSPAIQREIYKAFEGLCLTEEDPSFLFGLLRLTRQFQPEWPEWRGYDLRFFASIWEHLNTFGFCREAISGPIRRKPMFFSPTLRDGTMVRTCRLNGTWVGLEQNPFHLCLCELVHLWFGPSAPPLWAIGSGLEVHGREQLSFELSSPKPSIFARITEMEACDIGIVLEERPIRFNLRTSEAGFYRQQADSSASLKKLRSASSTLGAMQTCVALGKLRPGGLLWWAREEPLNTKDGKEILNYLLTRSKLLCEWDFSDVTHSLPVSAPIFPKYLYLFNREADLQSRLEHRPLRISIEGQIRSHIEVPLILGDAFTAFNAGLTEPQAREHWQIRIHKSPTPQKEWEDCWPDQANNDTLRRLDELRSSSLPLASFSTIRPTPEGDPKHDNAWTVPQKTCGLWLQTDQSGDMRRMVAKPFPKHGEGVNGSGIMVLVTDESWLAPLGAYLESAQIQKWLEHNAQRRGERWLLTEQLIKFLPLAKSFLLAMGIDSTPDNPWNPCHNINLPAEWDKFDIFQQATAIRDKLANLPHDRDGQRVRMALFVRAARAIERGKSEQTRLLPLVRTSGAIFWKGIMDILPRSECTPVAMSQHIELSGSMPPHIPIAHFEKVKMPRPGIILATETGMSLFLGAEQPRIIDILWDQLEGLKHPTWNELAQYLKLPRRLDLAENTASDILRAHGEQSLRLKELSLLLSSCANF